MSTAPKRPSELRRLEQATKLQNVLYEIRGPVNAEAERMEAEGHPGLPLTTTVL
jgi:alanine-synthesizing transaminase